MNLIARDNIVETLIRLGPEDGLFDLQSYFWRVIPVDQFGDEPSVPATLRTFSIDQFDNPEVPGVIGGDVVDGETGVPIQGAEITVKDGPTVVAIGISDSTGGYVIPNIASGSYTLEAEAAGGLYQRIDSVFVPAGGKSTVDFALTPGAPTSLSCQQAAGDNLHNAGRSAVPMGDVLLTLLIATALSTIQRRTPRNSSTERI